MKNQAFIEKLKGHCFHKGFRQAMTNMTHVPINNTLIKTDGKGSSEITITFEEHGVDLNLRIYGRRCPFQVEGKFSYEQIQDAYIGDDWLNEFVRILCEDFGKELFRGLMNHG